LDDVGVTEPLDYLALPVRMRQAAALIAVSEWVRRRGLEVAGLDELFDHLWGWMTVTPESFDSWHGFDSPLLTAALGGELPSEVADSVDAVGVNARAFRDLLEHLVEITYGYLFGATNERSGLMDLVVISQAIAADGVNLPSPLLFGDDRYGDNAWGSPSAAQVAAWKASTS
jgi:hypothetical protein